MMSARLIAFREVNTMSASPFERAMIVFFRLTMAWTFLYAASHQVFDPHFTVAQPSREPFQQPPPPITIASLNARVRLLDAALGLNSRSARAGAARLRGSSSRRFERG